MSQEQPPVCLNCHDNKVKRVSGAAAKNPGREFWTCKNDCANAFEWVKKVYHKKENDSMLTKRKVPETPRETDTTLEQIRKINSDILKQIIELKDLLYIKKDTGAPFFTVVESQDPYE